MTQRREVVPLSAEGYDMTFLGLFSTVGPKWDIVCGDCGRGFSQRLDTSVERQRLLCPRCGAFNVFTTYWEND